MRWPFACVSTQTCGSIFAIKKRKKLAYQKKKKKINKMQRALSMIEILENSFKENQYRGIFQFVTQAVIGTTLKFEEVQIKHFLKENEKFYFLPHNFIDFFGKMIKVEPEYLLQFAKMAQITSMDQIFRMKKL